MVFHTPDWVKHAVFYQIFPDRFAKADAQQPFIWRSPRLESWDADPTLQGYKGGNLWGVIEKLDYLEDLGINAIYFTPIFQSASNHRYHTHDYYQVDPLLGGNAAFFALLEAAHQRNIKVVLDGVFNHASRGFYYFNDILEHGPYSPWLDWFVIENWPLSAYDGDKPANYCSWVNNRALPKFNHDNPQVKEYIMQVAEYWLNKGIDGWRLDVPNEITTAGFWEEFRDRVKTINPEAYIVGEIWTDATQWLDGKQFDGVMNYPFTEATTAFVAGKHLLPEYLNNPDFQPVPPIDAVTYSKKIQDLCDRHPWDIQLTQLNLLDSHDTARMLTLVNDDVPTLALLSIMLMTYVGAPSIYYGDEVGLAGGIDPDCRRSFPPETQWNRELLQLYKDLIAVRHAHVALRLGDYQILYAQGSQYIFLRTYAEDVVLVAINVAHAPCTFAIPWIEDPEVISDILLGTGDFHCKAQQLSLKLPGRSALILGKKP